MDPATAATLGAIGAIAGPVFTAAGAIADANNQASISEYNARVAEQNAVAAQQAGAYEEARLRDRHKKFLATQRAAAGAAGVTMEGAPALIQAESAAEMELDALALRYSTSVEAARSRAQAAGDRLAARVQRAAGWGAAGGSLLTGATELAGAFSEGGAFA